MGKHPFQLECPELQTPRDALLPRWVFNYNPVATGNFYLKSPVLNTTGYTQLTLSYKHHLDHYGTPYTLKLMSIVGSTEYLIQQWVNPSVSIPAATVQNTLTASHGVGSDNLRLAWVSAVIHTM